MLTASFGLTGSNNSFNQLYNNALSQQRINIGFSIPVVDWGRSRAQIQTALRNCWAACYDLRRLTLYDFEKHSSYCKIINFGTFYLQKITGYVNEKSPV